MSDEHKPMPDLREVFERARRLDPDAVDGLFGEEERQNVLELVPRDDGPSPRLDAFLDAVRDDLDERASQRALQSIPAPPAVQRRTRWTLIGAAAAAALLASWGVYGVVASGASGSDAAQLAEAPMTARAGDASTLAQPLPPATPTQSAREVPEPEPDVETESDPETESDASPPADTAASAIPDESTSAGAKARASSPKVEDPADSLEAQAQAAWAAGDLALAEELLRKLVKTTRSRSRREQAYGDLLSLLEVRGDDSRTRQLWRSYLRKYPHGRYADDLQARICRSEATSECWTQYLKMHPKGAHRREAESKTRP